MRDIVFRGKTIEDGAWICGDLRQYSESRMGIKPRHMPHTTKVVPDTVGQYTGVKDKNGVRIFEGDIVRARIEGKAALRDFEWPLQKCVFRDGAFGLAHEIRETVWEVTPLRSYAPSVTFEIVGNIYDTPEEV